MIFRCSLPYIRLLTLVLLPAFVAAQPIWQAESARPIPEAPARYRLGPQFNPSFGFSDFRTARGERLKTGRGDAIDSLGSSHKYRFRELLDRQDPVGDDRSFEVRRFFDQALKSKNFQGKEADLPGLCALLYQSLVDRAEEHLAARYQLIVRTERLAAKRLSHLDEHDRARARARRAGGSHHRAQAARLRSEVEDLRRRRDALRGNLSEADLTRGRLRAWRQTLAKTVRQKARKIHSAAETSLRLR